MKRKPAEAGWNDIEIFWQDCNTFHHLNGQAMQHPCSLPITTFLEITNNLTGNIFAHLLALFSLNECGALAYSLLNPAKGGLDGY